MFRAFGFFASLVILILAQPDISQFFSLLGFACGYGLLWYSLEPLKGLHLSRKALFFSLFFWSLTVEAFHFSWMLSDLYVGKFIYLVWIFLIGILAFLFSCFSYLLITVMRQRMLKLLWCLPGVWVAMEMIRFYGICSGMSLDYLGLPMTACSYGRQFGGFFGWAGQSFVIVAVGISFYCVLLRKAFAKICWSISLILPFCLGGIHYEYLKHRAVENNENLNVAVVQPAISPEDPPLKNPVQAWQRLIDLIANIHKPIDVLIFPEVAVPFDSSKRIYSYEDSLPVLAPFVIPDKKDGLTNFDWVQILSQYFRCPVLIGMERWEESSEHIYFYNSAELISEQEQQGYDKRVLVPGGEYIPGGRLGKFICKKFFPEQMLTCLRLPGIRSGIIKVSGLPALGVSICYEETFGYLLRIYKQQGARLLVNLTNDGWYPSSRLPQVHFSHGILRNQELGMPCVRACQTGVTAAVDSLGRIVSQLPYETRNQKAVPGVLQVSIPLFTYQTLYAYCGDWIMGCIALCLSGYLGVGIIGYRLLAKKEKG
ncbi:apolipoprotein N-acyltransferase [Chlamydia sp. 17-3921]|uniref:apolipoprotein N-acyltransferase n=1 Tax=Chlamydia sp. 17-3921 TaxID=2675798 RepID=UPI00191A7FF8|nr:apolipoprotein N-acyltransferase [Chlamydia sp. 17-3921]